MSGTTGTTIEVTDEDVIDCIASVISRAEQTAERVALVLERIGMVPGLRQRMKTPIELPRAFLLELGAAIEIRDWEMSGVAQQALADLPTSEEALASAFDTFHKLSTSAVESEPAPTLPLRVFATWHRHFALSGPADLGINVVIGGTSPPESLELVADFIWRFRHLGRETN